jgi:hypothetical protein
MQCWNASARQASIYIVAGYSTHEPEYRTMALGNVICRRVRSVGIVRVLSGSGIKSFRSETASAAASEAFGC